MYRIEIFTDQMEYASADILPDDIKIELDYLAYDSYTVTTRIISCKKGYFTHITKDGVTIADGIVASVYPSKTMQEISIQPINAMFDQEVFYSPINDCITWLANNITAQYINNADTVQNRPVSVIYTVAQSSLPLTGGFNLNKTTNILSVMISALKTYGVVCDCSLDLQIKKVVVNIYQEVEVFHLEADLENVLESDVTLGDSYGSTNKVIIRKTDEDDAFILDRTYYLHTDGSINTTDNNRIQPVFWELVILQQTSTMTDAEWNSDANTKAKEVLTPTQYDQEILLKYHSSDTIAKPLERPIGSTGEIHIKGEVYSTILTGKTIKGNVVTLIFGAIRTTLTKKLNMEGRT